MSGADRVLHHVSGRAHVSPKAFLTPPIVVLGPSHIEIDVMVYSFTLIGFPSRKKLLELRELGRVSLKDLDEVSSGSKLGEGVIVRSHCTIYENVELLDGVELGHHVLIRENTVIGRRSKIGSGVVIDGYATIGEKANIQTGVYIPMRTRIGNSVFIGPRAVVTNDRYPPSKRMVETVIEDEAVVGANSTIVAGARIGRGAVIAAGAVVTGDVEPYTVVAGVPARPIMTRDEYERKKKLYEEAELKNRN